MNGTRNLKMSLSADNLGIIHWFVDESYVIHDNCNGLTGSMFTLGSGAQAFQGNRKSMQRIQWRLN